MTQRKIKTEHIVKIDSTNEELKRRFLAGESEPLLIRADEQTAGKGRNGHSFYSPQNTGIYFSFLYPCKDEKMLNETIFVTTLSAVSVCKAIRNATGANTQIKWINDIYLDMKKVCGILAEAVYRENSAGDRELGIIVGIGINLSTKDFPEDVSKIAGGLGDFSDASLEEIKEKIVTLVGEELLYFFEQPKDSDFRRRILEEYRAMSMVIGKQVSYYKDGEAEAKGTAVEILDDGSLVVENEEGLRTVLNSGEIHLKMNRDIAARPGSS